MDLFAVLDHLSDRNRARRLRKLLQLCQRLFRIVVLRHADTK